MKKERLSLLVSAIVNVIVAFVKILGGTLFNCYSFVADGIYTVMDFGTDIIAIVGETVGKKRANKRYLFGFGQFEYLLQIFFGLVMLLVGIYMAVRSFFLGYEPVKYGILFYLVIAFILKLLSSNYLMNRGCKLSSRILISNAKESFWDVTSTWIVVIIVLLMNIDYELFDQIGCIIMSLYMIIPALFIIRDKVIILLGNDSNNKTIKSNIKEIVDNYDKKIEYSDSFLIKFNNYYQCNVELAVSSRLSIPRLIYYEYRIKKLIKKNNKKILFVCFDEIRL